MANWHILLYWLR